MKEDLKKQNKNTFYFFTITIGIAFVLKGAGITDVSWSALLGLFLIASALFYFITKE